MVLEFVNYASACCAWLGALNSNPLAFSEVCSSGCRGSTAHYTNPGIDRRTRHSDSQPKGKAACGRCNRIHYGIWMQILVLHGRRGYAMRDGSEVQMISRLFKGSVFAGPYLEQSPSGNVVTGCVLNLHMDISPVIYFCVYSQCDSLGSSRCSSGQIAGRNLAVSVQDDRSAGSISGSYSCRCRVDLLGRCRQAQLRERLGPAVRLCPISHESPTPADDCDHVARRSLDLEA